MKHVSKRFWGEFVRLVVSSTDEDAGDSLPSTTPSTTSAEQENEVDSRSSSRSRQPQQQLLEHVEDKELAVNHYVRKLKGKDWIPSTISLAIPGSNSVDDDDCSVISDISMAISDPVLRRFSQEIRLDD